MVTGPSPAFGDLLRRFRVAAGLSQEALAERAGLSARAISDLERDWERAPRRDTLRLLAAALALSSNDEALLEASVSRVRRHPLSSYSRAFFPTNRLHGLGPTWTNHDLGSRHGQALWPASAIPSGINSVSAESEPYYYGPYPLERSFTGRAEVRRLLSEWLINGHQPVLTLTGMGGIGKSAVSWVWLQHDILGFDIPDLVAQDQVDERTCIAASKPLGGVFWWSFAEPESHFGLFLDEAISYLSSHSIDASSTTSVYMKLQSLVSLLQKYRFLIVLDGFERELRVYAGSSSHLGEVQDMQEGNEGSLRGCTNPHASRLLRWIGAQPLQSRVLVISRIYPRELDDLSFCRQESLTDLTLDDAVLFFAARQIRGTRAEIAAACSPYGYHPLALRLLTGAIIHHPERPGDLAVVTQFSAAVDRVSRETNAFASAFDALPELAQLLLSRVAAFRSLATFAAIRAVSPMEDDDALQVGLNDLVDRGLMLFDSSRAVYDLHPIVRHPAYERLPDKRPVHERLVAHFSSLMDSELLSRWSIRSEEALLHSTNSYGADLNNGVRQEDLAGLIELFHHMARSGCIENARTLYQTHLAEALYYRLGAYQTVIELLEPLVPAMTASMPNSDSGSSEGQLSWVLDALAHAYSACGYPRRAVQLLEMYLALDRRERECGDGAAVLRTVAVQQMVLGSLAAAEDNLQRSMAMCRDGGDAHNEALAHQYVALLRAYQGLPRESSRHLDAAMSLCEDVGSIELEVTICAYRALGALLAGDTAVAHAAAQRSRDLADVQSYERDIIRAEWLLGTTLVRSVHEGRKDAASNLSAAHGHLRNALGRCRRINMVDYEADILLALAWLESVIGDTQGAERSAVEALAIADRSEFRPLRADIHNFIARLELERDNIDGATSHARLAIADALCDGEPYCYRPALDEAQRLLAATTRSA